ncbi:MAG: SEC-C metal-binding domain-containing protein [Spirochaetaceae bacterium]|nr:SEC-C metal-binding domain-containing protein [Spirochaetaceae bacterium]
MPTEQEIFDSLATLSKSPGYVQALTLLCLRDNAVRFSGELTGPDLTNLYSSNRLLRTEQSVLLGLLIKNQVIDTTMPSQEQLEEYIKSTEDLLEKLHYAIAEPLTESMKQNLASQNVDNPLAIGDSLREEMFYAGEAAFSYQYIDLAVKKYRRDNTWLIDNKGFEIEHAREVFEAIGSILGARAHEAFIDPDSTPLSVITVSVGDVVQKSNLSETVVRNLFVAFSIDPSCSCNHHFNSIDDFNQANAKPLISISTDDIIVFNLTAVAEAIYVSPFHWMKDSDHKDKAAENRGRFTEDFVQERLSSIFDPGDIYRNVTISPGRRPLGEIDILVVYCNRALVIQIKSKQLTLEARRGNDKKIREDFEKAIQSAYNQAESCAEILADSNSYVIEADGVEIVDPTCHGIVEFYPICIISDNYPSLNTQVREFLSYKPTAQLRPPLVADVFLLDVATEMLESPIEFLSYLKMRVEHREQAVARDEYTILGFHLQHNLLLDPKFDWFYMHDDIAMDLDAAMLVRRGGIPGSRDVDGYVSRFRKTTIGKILRSIEDRKEPETIELGFLLAQLSESAVNDISKKIDYAMTKGRRDGLRHDFSLYIGALNVGLTVHCSNEEIARTKQYLITNSEMRKYDSRAKTWFGICIANDMTFRCGVRLHQNWEYNAQMERVVREWDRRVRQDQRIKYGRKLGRNDRCPCGSGKKFKRCCMHNTSKARRRY